MSTMLTLPFEILILTFSYLKTTDLLQCQLTSKEWYQASVDLLYSKVEISTSERSRLFGHTISNSSHLGARLKIIRTRQLFMTKLDNELWDEHDLLNKLIRHCPSILEIYSQTQDLSFWYRISHAVSRGHLSRLQVLPYTSFRNLEPYIHTALQFKASLTQLCINDTCCIIGNDLNRFEIYQELLDQIGEFKKLQNVELFYQSNKQLSYFDTLIDSCPHLKEVNIRLVSAERQRVIIEHEVLSISPRSDIRKLQCNWHTISTENQIQYIVHKFPNLQSLRIECFYYSEEIKPRSCPYNALIDFLHFATAISEFEIDMTLRYQDLTNVVTELINMKDVYRDISVSFAGSEPNINGLLLKLKPTTLSIVFTLGDIVDEFPWTKFFLETGNKIRSLTIELSFWFFSTKEQFQHSIDTMFFGIEDIFKMAQACPVLEELRIGLASYYSSPEEHVPEVANVQKLTVKDIEFEDKVLIEFLQLASLKLPNIKQLHLKFDGDDFDVYGAMTIVMKKTRLDLLIWRCNCIFNNNLVAYIRLKTRNHHSKFYIGYKTGLLPINARLYKLAVRNDDLLCFDITCQALTEFRITTKSSPSPKFRWIF